MTTTEAEAREVAEDSRQKTWLGTSFLKDVFLGRYRLDLLERLSFAESTRPQFTEFYDKMKTFLVEHVDPVQIDKTGEYPKHVLEGLAKLGAFGMKIPTEYGGLGLTHPEYVRTMQLVGSHDGNVSALLSAHQAIGVPQPVRLFGNEDQKQRFLPRCAKGAISAFALTERAVGSDPGSLATTATLSDDGSHYILSGEKLWCTNGTLAEMIVVMARNPATKKINCFVVEMNWPGVKVLNRCRFMGLKALANAVIRFDNVKVPKENLIGNEGDGLKIALVTLNTGRLSLPAATAGFGKVCADVVGKWSNARHQWGLPIGKHEAVAQKNAFIASSALALESVSLTVGALADRKDTDIRLEAAAAKEWNSVRCWKVIDETLQVRGGRGYETEQSLIDRGEPSIGIERAMRDNRINLIFEGSSEIMHLFIAREAVDKHLEVAGALVDPKASIGKKLAALPKIIAFYAWWYPTRWLKMSLWPQYSSYGKLAKHLRFASRASARLARSIFHGMVVHQAKLERKQGFLFRAVDVALEIFVMTATISRVQQLIKDNPEQADAAIQLADFVGLQGRRQINRSLRQMWRNDDNAAYAVGQALLNGKYDWLSRGSIEIPHTVDDLRPKTIEQIMAEPPRAKPQSAPATPPPASKTLNVA